MEARKVTVFAAFYEFLKWAIGRRSAPLRAAGMFAHPPRDKLHRLTLI